VILFQGRRAHEGDDSTILNRRDRRIGLTVLLYLLAVVPAAAFEDLGPVLAITGAVGGSCLAYIGPGVVYLGVHGGRFLELVQESWLGSKLLDSPYAVLWIQIHFR
jgi:sodium-coupled neutral amino acid transporter 11